MPFELFVGLTQHLCIQKILGASWLEKFSEQVGLTDFKEQIALFYLFFLNINQN